MPHMKIVPTEAVAKVAAFAGKHKFMLAGGAALAVGAGLYIHARNGAAAAAVDTGGSYTGGYIPISPGGGGGVYSDGGLGATTGGGGSLVPTATAGGSNAVGPPPVPTVDYSGAFGQYAGITADLAAQLDLTRQQMEYGYNQNIYVSTLDSNSVLASQNLQAYQSALTYGSNAGGVNVGLLSTGIDHGFNYQQLVDLANGIFSLNPITPTSSFNAPAYTNVPYTFGSGTAQNTGGQNVNNPSYVPAQSPAYVPYVSQIPAQSAQPNFNAYLSANPDLAGEAARVTADGEFATTADYAAWHYAHYGQAEGRVLPTA